MNILSQINETIKKYQFTEYGFAPVERPLSMDIYKNWIDNQCHGEMSYLKHHIPIKENPQKILPNAFPKEPKKPPPFLPPPPNKSAMEPNNPACPLAPASLLPSWV